MSISQLLCFLPFHLYLFNFFCVGTHLAIFYVNPQYYTQGYNKNRTTLINVCNIAQNIDIIRPISSFTLTGSFHYVIVCFVLFVCSVAFVCKFYDHDQASTETETT